MNPAALGVLAEVFDLLSQTPEAEWPRLRRQIRGLKVEPAPKPSVDAEQAKDWIRKLQPVEADFDEPPAEATTATTAGYAPELASELARLGCRAVYEIIERASWVGPLSTAEVAGLALRHGWLTQAGGPGRRQMTFKALRVAQREGIVSRPPGKRAYWSRADAGTPAPASPAIDAPPAPARSASATATTPTHAPRPPAARPPRAPVAATRAPMQAGLAAPKPSDAVAAYLAGGGAITRLPGSGSPELLALNRPVPAGAIQPSVDRSDS